MVGGHGALRPRNSGPTVLRILVGSQIRRLREAAGISREAAADVIRGSEAKMSRIETGRTGFKQRDIVDLLSLYGVTDDAEREAVLGLARQANEPGWWQPYSDSMPGWLELYVGLAGQPDLVGAAVGVDGDGRLVTAGRPGGTVGRTRGAPGRNDGQDQNGGRSHPTNSHINP